MAIVSRNVDLGPPLKLSSWRKVAIGTWRTVGDPSVYGTLEIDVTPSLSYIEKLRQQSGRKVTLSHLIGKAVAQTLQHHPELNCILRWGRLYPRKRIDVFFQVATDVKGQDLSGATIREVNQKSILEIVEEMEKKVSRIRQHGDPDYKKMKGTMGLLPGILTSTFIDIAGFLMYALNLWSPLFGSPKDPFGSVMITNIGSLGLDSAFAPLVPYSRVPLLIALGAVKEIPVVRNGKIEIVPTCKLCATFDHRLIDGMHASHMVKTLKKILDNPEKELA